MTPAQKFYKDTLARLREADIPHLVGGAFAMIHVVCARGREPPIRLIEIATSADRSARDS